MFLNRHLTVSETCDINQTPIKINILQMTVYCEVSLSIFGLNIFGRTTIYFFFHFVVKLFLIFFFNSFFSFTNNCCFNRIQNLALGKNYAKNRFYFQYLLITSQRSDLMPYLVCFYLLKQLLFVWFTQELQDILQINQ